MDIEKKEEQPLRSTAGNHSPKHNRRRCIIISSSITGLILTITLILLILALTVFKPKKPVLTVNSVALDDLDFSITPLPLPPKVSLNLSLAIGISIKNPNKVGVKYRNSSATLQYRGRDVGDVPIPAGKIGADGTEDLNLTVTIFADRLVTDSEIYRDIIGGNLPFSTYTKIKAKVRVVFFHIRVTSTSTCDVNIDIGSRSIANQTCHYNNKLD